MDGNPTILIPCEARTGDQRLVIRTPDGEAVWSSYPLSGAKDAVRVDVWQGEFVGQCEACSVLSGGNYVAFLGSATGGRRELQRLHVEGQTLFSGTFSGLRDHWFGQDGEWHTDGEWQARRGGIAAKDGPAYLFADGAMHGTLEAVFERSGSADEAGAWGLISRHYNAFAHYKLVLTSENDLLRVGLVCIMGTGGTGFTENLLGEGLFKGSARGEVRLRWELNGRRNAAWINDQPVLTGLSDYMGGVTVVGFFSQTPSVCWKRFSMTTTQAVPMHEIIHPQYRAVIRPGNIQRLWLRESGDPRMNVFWESGIQFGHIGGSELKFTQGAQLERICEGPAVSVVRWEGPMPKFVEQSVDVRGRAHGTACFYPDRIVLADFVLPWVRRSVGPDFDMFAGAMNGPARVALATDRQLQEWVLPDDGASNVLPGRRCDQMYPVAVAFPLSLGGEQWYLKAVIGNLLHVAGDAPGRMFAWRCLRGLTASHDFRVAPSTPGVEYGFSILVTWQRSDDASQVEKDLLDLREAWYCPAVVAPLIGSLVEYRDEKEHPAEAIAFDGCFDRATGTYVVRAEGGRSAVRFDPGGVTRRRVAFWVRGLPREGELACTRNGQPMQSGTDYLAQPFLGGSRLVMINPPVDQTATFEFAVKGSV